MSFFPHIGLLFPFYFFPSPKKFSFIGRSSFGLSSFFFFFFYKSSPSTRSSSSQNRRFSSVSLPGFEVPNYEEWSPQPLTLIDFPPPPCFSTVSLKPSLLSGNFSPSIDPWCFGLGIPCLTFLQDSLIVVCFFYGTPVQKDPSTLSCFLT